MLKKVFLGEMLADHAQDKDNLIEYQILTSRAELSQGKSCLKSLVLKLLIVSYIWLKSLIHLNDYNSH